MAVRNFYIHKSVILTLSLVGTITVAEEIINAEFIEESQIPNCSTVVDGDLISKVTVGETEFNVTDGQLREIRNSAQGFVTRLTGLAQNPGEIMTIGTQTALSQMEETNETVAKFIKGNHLLTQRGSGSFTRVEARLGTPNQTAGDGGNLILNSQTAVQLANEYSEKMATSMDDLLRNLRTLNGQFTIRGRMVRAVQDNAIARRLLRRVAEQFDNAASQIQELDGILARGALEASHNMQQLNRLRQISYEYSKTLEMEILVLDNTIAAVRNEINHLSATNPTVANSLRVEALPILERTLIDKQSLYGTLVTASEAFAQSAQVLQYNIQDANSLRQTAAPAVAVMASVRNTNRAAREQAQRHQMTRQFTRQIVINTVREMRETNEQLAQQWGQPTLDAETLEQVLTQITEEKTRSRERMVQASERLHNQNQRIRGVLQRFSMAQTEERLGDATSSMISEVLSEARQLQQLPTDQFRSNVEQRETVTVEQRNGN